MRCGGKRCGRRTGVAAKLIDLTGKRFGRLYVLNFSHVGRNRQPFWNAVCDCGTLTTMRGGDLRGHRNRRGSRSCGCVRKHGWAYSAEYVAYINARARCTRPDLPCWRNYGGRGIEFRFRTFEEFLAAAGPKPSPELTLDRIDVNGHYEVGNLRWTTRSVQSANQRRWLKGRI